MSIHAQSPDPVARALSELEPGTRALLDLSLRRALSDQELARLVAADPGEIALRRERALDAIAAEAGIDGPATREQVSARLLAVPSEAWPATAGPDPPQAPKPVAAASRPPIKDARGTVVTGRGASLGPPPGHVSPAPIGGMPMRPAGRPPTLNRNRVTALVVAAALIAVLLLQMAGSSDEAAPGPAPAPDAPAQQEPTSHFQRPLIQVQRA